jgi:hypothetical protein
MKLTPEQQAFSWYLPEDTLQYFDVVSSQRDDKSLHIILEEKNNPPLEARHNGQSMESLGFTNISITDFPTRGRKTTLTFRRRRWRVGSEILKREINLRAPGTQLEREFGLFLKALLESEWVKI